MGRLFWKIFAWFWIAMVTIGVAVGWGVKLFVENTQQDRWHQLPRVQIEAVSHTLEEAGVSATRKLLQSIDSQSQVPIFVLNAQQQDLLGRPFPRHLLGPGVNLPPHMLMYRKQVRTPDGEVFRVIAPNPRNIRRLEWQQDSLRLLAIFIALFTSALVCFWLTKYITTPVKKLSNASRKLAKGELNVRVEDNGGRKDEITELSTDFNQMAERLQKLIQAQAQLFSDISHELRSPLARLQVATALAYKDLEQFKTVIDSADPNDKSIQQLQQKEPVQLARIQKDIDRMDDLVGQILTLSKLETATQPSHYSFLNLSELIAEIISDAQIEAQQKPCHLSYTPITLPRLSGDRELLHRAIENIIRNAVYYTHPHTEISVDTQVRDQVLIITVCDLGPGVADDHLNNIFEPFIRTDAARERNTGGYGLGMAIAKRATLAHNGNIRAYHNQPSGLCVEITLPLK